MFALRIRWYPRTNAPVVVTSPPFISKMPVDFIEASPLWQMRSQFALTVPPFTVNLPVQTAVAEP